MSTSKFEIVDRRGDKKKDEAPVIVEPTTPAIAGNRSTWENVGYMIVLIPSNAGPIVTGRAVGLRADEKCFIADYFLPQIYPEKFDWTEKARERLDTFLGCECLGGTPCATHKIYVSQWIKADTQRLELIGNSAVPEAIEVMVKADRARKATGIVAPR